MDKGPAREQAWTTKFGYSPLEVRTNPTKGYLEILGRSVGSRVGKTGLDTVAKSLPVPFTQVQCTLEEEKVGWWLRRKDYLSPC